MTTKREVADSPGPMPILSLSDVSAGYDELEVLREINLSIAAGEVIAVLGPNGAGKSTLLKVASGRVRPSRGDMRFNGESVVGRPADWLAQRGICAIPEGRGVFSNLTVADNLNMWSFGRGATFSRIEEVVYTQFPVLGDRRKQLAGTLSGGEQQMLALSRALVTEPKVLLLDEISMGLAPRIVDGLYKIVAAMAATGVAVLLVEQFAEIGLRIADRAAVLTQGAIRLVGRPDEVRDSLAQTYLGIPAGHASREQAGKPSESSEHN